MLTFKIPFFSKINWEPKWLPRALYAYAHRYAFPLSHPCRLRTAGCIKYLASNTMTPLSTHDSLIWVEMRLQWSGISCCALFSCSNAWYSGQDYRKASACVAFECWNNYLSKYKSGDGTSELVFMRGSLKKSVIYCVFTPSLFEILAQRADITDCPQIKPHGSWTWYLWLLRVGGCGVAPKARTDKFILTSAKHATVRISDPSISP